MIWNLNGMQYTRDITERSSSKNSKTLNFSSVHSGKIQSFRIFAGYTRAQNVCPGWRVYEVKQPQEKWACDFHDDALPMSFQLQVAEVIF